MIDEVFKRSKVNFKKLEKYGFIKNDKEYYYSKKFLNDEFEARIVINENGTISGKVIEVDFNEEYINIYNEMQDGSFVNKVRLSYEEILNDIKDNCFESEQFIFPQSNRISNYIIQKYKSNPEFYGIIFHHMEYLEIQIIKNGLLLL